MNTNQYYDEDITFNYICIETDLTSSRLQNCIVSFDQSSEEWSVNVGYQLHITNRKLVIILKELSTKGITIINNKNVDLFSYFYDSKSPLSSWLVNILTSCCSYLNLSEEDITNLDINTKISFEKNLLSFKNFAKEISPSYLGFMQEVAFSYLDIIENYEEKSKLSNIFNYEWNGINGWLA